MSEKYQRLLSVVENMKSVWKILRIAVIVLLVLFLGYFVFTVGQL